MSQDISVVKQEIYVKFGKFRRQYPLSFVELKDLSTGEVIGGGMCADDLMSYNGAPIGNELDVPFEIDPVINPKIFETNEIATAVMANRFQW